jgi:hypothetical protein
MDFEIIRNLDVGTTYAWEASLMTCHRRMDQSVNKKLEELGTVTGADGMRHS